MATARVQSFMRTTDTIDAELGVLAAYRSACIADGEPVRSTAVVDQLLDERRSVAAAGPGDQPAVVA